MKVLRPARRRMAAWGAAAAFLYVAAAVASVSLGLVHGRTLYDGLPAQPYRWITPPPQRVRDNQKPDSIDTTTNINATGLPDPQSVSTGDLQATVIFEKVDPKEYAPDKPTDMKVRITPLDPTTVGPRPALVRQPPFPRTALSAIILWAPRGGGAAFHRQMTTDNR